MTLSFEQALRLMDANKSSLKEDLKKLESIRDSVSKVEKNYSRITQAQRISSRELNRNLKLIANLRKAIFKNIDGSTNSNVQKTLFNDIQKVLIKEISRRNKILGQITNSFLKNIDFGALTKGIINNAALPQPQTSPFSSAANSAFIPVNNSLNKSTGQIIAETAQALQKAIRNL